MVFKCKETIVTFSITICNVDSFTVSSHKASGCEGIKLYGNDNPLYHIQLVESTTLFAGK